MIDSVEVTRLVLIRFHTSRPHSTQMAKLGEAGAEDGEHHGVHASRNSGWIIDQVKPRTECL